jgi:Tfp pilus assembly protein PilF
MVLGDLESAYEVVRDALEEMEKQPRSSRMARLELLNGMGYEYLRVRKTVLARSLFLKARSLAPYHAASSLGLARAYRGEGDRKAAIEQYRRVLKLERHNVEAKRELKKLLTETPP